MRLTACSTRSVMLLLVAMMACAGCRTVSEVSKSPSLVNLKGERVALVPDPGQAGSCVLFLSIDCPISQRYSPEIARLGGAFPQIRFWLVYPNADETNPAVARHFREFELPGEPWRDPGQRLVQLAAATVTPEAVVFAADGRVVYRGRIDDRYVDLGKARHQPTRRDLEAVLKKLAAGEPVEPTRTEAIGCSIAAGR